MWSYGEEKTCLSELLHLLGLHSPGLCSLVAEILVGALGAFIKESLLLFCEWPALLQQLSIPAQPQAINDSYMDPRTGATVGQKWIYS